MLLFSEDPEKWLQGAYTKIGYFETDADLLYQDEIQGALLEQVDKISEIAHLKYMKAKITYEKMRRIERYFVPDAALREAILNALCHKDYSCGIPIQISIYEDRLYIANCGRLPENWTVQNLMSKHASKPFNPNVAHVFYLAGFIESWGRGIEKICRACREDGVPVPEYTIHLGDIMIKFTAPKDRVIRMVGYGADGIDGIDGIDDRENAINPQLPVEEQILELLNEDPAYTYANLSEKTKLGIRTVSRCIKNLKVKGLITRIGSDRIDYWKVNKCQ